VDHSSSHRAAPGSNPLRTTSGSACSPSHPNTVSRLPLRRHRRKTPFLSHTRPRVVLPPSHFVRQRYCSFFFSTPRTLVPVRWRAPTLSWTGAPTVRYSICQSEPESQQSTRWQQSAISDLFCPATAIHLLSLRQLRRPARLPSTCEIPCDACCVVGPENGVIRTFPASGAAISRGIRTRSSPDRPTIKTHVLERSWGYDTTIKARACSSRGPKTGWLRRTGFTNTNTGLCRLTCSPESHTLQGRKPIK
jgi:hypothetical protein